MTGKATSCLLLLCLVVLAGCGPPSATPVLTPPEAEPMTPLPTPVLVSEMSLNEALVQRRSIRDFRNVPLTDAEIGQLLWAAQGITNDRGFRSAPSAGALYPLEFYVAIEDGIYHYDPSRHGLRRVSTQDSRQALYEAALRQEPVRQAPVVFVLTAVYARTEGKYGVERSPRYVHLEAGHAAQNLLLEAVALDLGAVPIGAFQDEEVQQVLGLPADRQPLYLIPVGRPRRASP